MRPILAERNAYSGRILILVKSAQHDLSHAHIDNKLLSDYPCKVVGE
jgi:hypothetical protein